jgi:Fe2+ or Zn2+ uptake regulation protein
MMKNTVEIIKKAGLKATPQRKMIYEIMTKLGHASMDEIIAKAQQQSPDFTLSTVYRILDSFCEAGIMSKMASPNGKCYYDITTSEHSHIFRDNTIIDYMDAELMMLIKEHLKEKSFQHFDSIEKIAIQIVVADENEL